MEYYYAIKYPTVILNITGGVDYQTKDFDKDAVKEWFNADWGATTFVNLKYESLISFAQISIRV